MADWKSTNKDRNRLDGSYGEEKVTSLIFSWKSGFELMQNCDLPPPVKVFAGPDKTILSPMIAPGDEEGKNELSRNNSENEKLELLKALRLSQTRAREAERKLDDLFKERDALSNLLIQESVQLFAYKQWVKLMELQVSKLGNQQNKQSNCSATPEDDGNHTVSKSMTWLVAVALCLGIAGFSFAFGCRCMF